MITFRLIYFFLDNICHYLIKLLKSYLSNKQGDKLNKIDNRLINQNE